MFTPKKTAEEKMNFLKVMWFFAGCIFTLAALFAFIGFLELPQAIFNSAGLAACGLIYFIMMDNVKEKEKENIEEKKHGKNKT